MSDDTVDLPGPYLMLRHGGRDLVARIAGEGGWMAFERPMPEIFFAAASGLPGLVVDVGCNTGFYALLACAASPQNRVIAFEPDPTIQPLVAANISLNRLGGRIETSPLALSDVAREAQLYVPDQAHGLIESASSLEVTFFQGKHSAALPVKTARLDEVLREENQPVRIMKIGVEGHEMAVLAGATATVARFRPLIFVEILDRADNDGLTDFVLSHRYADIPIRADQPLGVAERVAFEPLAWNHALVPLELVSQFFAFVGQPAPYGPGLT
jgi:FkbM family methyltransferase